MESAAKITYTNFRATFMLAKIPLEVGTLGICHKTFDINLF
jgi:hypothetical protein